MSIAYMASMASMKDVTAIFPIYKMTLSSCVFSTTFPIISLALKASLSQSPIFPLL